MKLTESQVARLKELESIEGRLLPSLVVADAKMKASPLHDLFEWNVEKAAEVQWTQRAREIIGAVLIVVNTTQTVIRAPLYVRDPDQKGEGYRTVTSLRDDPDSARESLIYTLTVASGHLRRALDLAQPLGLSGEIDAMLQQIAGVQRIASKKAA